MLHRRRGNGREHGQILVLFTLVLVVILVFAAIVVDLGVLRNNRQILRNTTDAAALAGGTLMPVDGSVPGNAAAVRSLIDSTIQKNYPGLPTSAYTISYRCLIGVNGGAPDYAQITAGMCNPSHALGHAPGPSYPNDWTGAGETRTSACNPSAGDKCNVVVVTGSATTEYQIGGVVGIGSGSTGAVQSAACNGPCGKMAIAPTDLVVIIDRTASMSEADVQATRDAVNAVLQVYNPAYQRVALGFLGPSSTTTKSPAVARTPASTSCINTSSFSVYAKALTSSSGYGTAIPGNLTSWIPVGLSGTDGGATFNEAYSSGTTQPYTLASPSTSHLVDAINCFDNPGGTGTNLATPILMAQAILDADTRPGVIKGILFETDGQPNYGVGTATDYTCLQADQNATIAKNAGIKLYTVGFGLDGANNVNCPDTSGVFRNQKVTSLLASMATQPTTDDLCVAAENTDGDNFFCQPKSADLQAIFREVAYNLASGGLHLIQLYPTPVVTGVGPSSGSHLGGNSVTITGQYFTGAILVTFGGASAAFTVTSDTSITATAPAGATGTVDIRVTTGGGASPIVTADRYTYT